ncbi:unnamed protein product [Microthlaspi erraticum]|uniref:Retrotransposon gag domain-containing protein n=2 Tax=Microthlaspi erraticum TaxID=1685480 RepID=A0A6D2JG59_9BRAS|nr:unnamed protein product [Microthlaspi erraticum]
MSDSDDQEERDNLAAREIALAEQREDPPDPNAAHDRANDGMPRDGARTMKKSWEISIPIQHYRKALRWVKSLPAQSITTWKEYKVAFLGLHKECPNHGLSDGSLWNIFYRGISGKCRFSLDTASNGNFMTKTVTEAKILIENLASSDSDNFIGHERAVKAINSDPYRDGYSEIKAMMAEILRNQGREVERQREAYRVESTIIQDYFGDLIPNFPRRKSPNEKRDVHGGRNYQQPPHKRRMEPRSNFEDLITFIKSSHREHTALIDERLESAFTRLNENIPRSRGSNAANQEETNGVCHYWRWTEPPKEVHVRIEPGTQEEVEKPPEEPRVYEPKIPYRNVLSQPKKEKEQAKLKDLVSQLSVRLPFIDACQIIPSLRKYMKAILTSNVSLEEGAMMITKECSAILQNRMPEKLNDPGSFVLSCKIGSTHFHRALCDLGSSVNLMPYSVAKLLGITDFKPTKISLVFADRSVRRPVGVIMDVPIMVGDCYIPADFVVLELEHQPKDPLILGRPFLATAGAIIDVKNGKIDLHLGDIVMNFEVNKSMEKPTVDGQAFWIGELAETREEVLDELLLIDPLELALTKAENEYGYMEREAQCLVKFMDSRKLIKS